jgi:hypothetical protein
MQAAPLDLPLSGDWRFEVDVRGADAKQARTAVNVAFDATAAQRLPRWREMAAWIFWPLAPIALFGTHLWLTRKDKMRKPGGRA